MKKSNLILAIFFLFAISSQAQIFDWGVKAGVNYANLSGSEITVNAKNYKSDAITSFHAGLVAKVRLFEGVALQPELLYSTQGASYKINVGELIKNEIGYISIPVMAKIDLNKTFSLELGPQASFLLSDKDKFVVKDYSTFDFSAAAGLGVKITDNIFLQARYVLGLTEISKNAEAKNSVVQVSAGVFF